MILNSGTSQVVLVVKKPLANAEDVGLIPGLGRPLEEEMATHSSILPGKSHGQRSLAGYSPWRHRVGYNRSNLARARRNDWLHRVGSKPEKTPLFKYVFTA